MRINGPKMKTSIFLRWFAAEGGPTCDPKTGSNYPTDHKWTIYGPYMVCISVYGPYMVRIWSIYGLLDNYYYF